MGANFSRTLTVVLQPGSRVGPYEVVALIGRGGMGEVWKARDTRLDRLVALKRLDPAHAARFEREARAIAALNHPHICQIHDIGPDYLVLEYVDGRPLEGPMPVDEAVPLAIQVASALEAAHQRGILHRDLKPANIMVTRTGGASPAEGPAITKLLDFGLATAIASDADDAQTRATRSMDGTIVGTVAYMSPEQAEGRPLDARSDVFSFGAVLYELLSGRRAFAGDTMVQTLSAVLRADPAPLASPDLDRIVRRCLAKNPADRFASMADIRAALAGLTTGPSSDERRSIAVLPFVDMSPARETDYFGDGLAEELITALAQTPGLKVIARTSAFAFKEQQTDVRRIAEALGVTSILEGSVRRSGSRIRVTAQLIAAADGSHVWSERFDRELVDVFDLQDDITSAIVAALKMQWSVQAPPRRYVPGTPVYEAFLKARYVLARETPEDFDRSRRYLEEAIALDPAFAMAHSWLAMLHVYTAGFTLRPSHDVIPLARVHATRAVELDPSLSEAHAVLALVAAAYDYNWAEASRCFQLAMAREPVPPLTRFNYGLHYLLPLGRADEAVEQFERGLREDPINVVRHVHLAFAHSAGGRADAATDATRRALELDERSWVALFNRTMLEAESGRLDAALHTIEQAYAIAPWSAAVIGVRAALFMLSGQSARGEELLRTLGDGEAFGAPFALMVHFLLRHDVDRAALWARKSIDQRDLNIGWLLRTSSAAALRASAHWPGLARMMNLVDARG